MRCISTTMRRLRGAASSGDFPKKRATPKIEVESDVLVGTLHYGSVLCASGTMGYKHRPVDHDTVLKGMKAPNFILKIIPHVDGSLRGSASWCASISRTSS